MDPITAAFVSWMVSEAGGEGLDWLKRLVRGDKQQNALRVVVREAIVSAVNEAVAADDRRLVREALLRESPGAAEVRVADAFDLRSAILAQLDPRMDVLAEQGYNIDSGRLAEGITSRIEMGIQQNAIRNGPLKPLAEWLRHKTVVERLPDLTQDRGATPVTPDQLPPRVAGFTGRDTELALITGLLEPASAAGVVAVCAVAGMAGVGKTALVVEAGHHAREHGWFPGGIFFLDLHGYDDKPVEPRRALEELLRALDPGTRIPSEYDARAALYRSVLATRRPLLLIADNASSEAQVRPLLPGSGPHRVVVTSRHTLGGLGARLLNVVVLDNQEGIALIDAVLRVASPDDRRIADNPQDAERLARMCAGLPLALSIVAAILTTDQAARAVSDLAKELAQEQERLERLRYDDGSEPARSVEAAFTLSYRRLEETAARMFRLLPVNPGPDVSTSAAAVLADLPVGRARELLAGLARAHLIEAAPNAEGRWRMHDLLRLYAQGLSGEEADADGREQATDRLYGYYVHMAEAANVHLTQPSAALPEPFTGPDDALAWLDAERPNLENVIKVAAATGRHQVAYRLPVVLGDYFAWGSYIDAWLSTAEAGLDAARRLGDRESEAWALNNRGLAFRAVRRLDEAITDHRDAAATFRAIGDRHSEGRALHNLAMALGEAGRLDEAIPVFRQDLAICYETSDRHGGAVTLIGLCDALREAGRLDEAITCGQRAVAIFHEAGDRRGEGQALNSLAGVLTKRADSHAEIASLLDIVEASEQSREQPDQAITVAQRAAALLRETGDRYNQGMALITLSAALDQAGRHDEMIDCSQHAAAILRKAGERHGAGRALNNLGAALSRVGRFDEAITADRQAADIFHQTGDRAREGEALQGLAIVLRQVGRSDDAITASRDAAASFHEAGDRPREGKALFGLAAALGQGGHFDEAITASRDAAGIFHEAGDRHSEGRALVIHSAALQERGRFDEAITAAQAAVAILQDASGIHAKGQALFTLGMALRQMGRPDEAIRASQEAATIFEVWGDRRAQAQALDNLGLALQEVDRFGEAITAHKEAAALFESTRDERARRRALDNRKSARAARRRRK